MPASSMQVSSADNRCMTLALRASHACPWLPACLAALQVGPKASPGTPLDVPVQVPAPGFPK
jgi:hypothetical protein